MYRLTFSPFLKLNAIRRTDIKYQLGINQLAQIGIEILLALIEFGRHLYIHKLQGLQHKEKSWAGQQDFKNRQTSGTSPPDRLLVQYSFTTQPRCSSCKEQRKQVLKVMRIYHFFCKQTN